MLYKKRLTLTNILVPFARRWWEQLICRLSLAQHQRHASKGAYVMQFDAAQPAQLRALTDWIIP